MLRYYGGSASHNRLELLVDTDDFPLAPGERIHLEPQLILWGEVDEVHKKYLELVGRKMKARVRGKKPSG